MDCLRKPLERQGVLVLADGNYVEFFAERNIDIHVAKIPQPGSYGLEGLAEQCLEASIPWRFRHLFDRSKLRGNAFIWPLPASVAQDALRVKRIVAAVNKLQEEAESEAA